MVSFETRFGRLSPSPLLVAVPAGTSPRPMLQAQDTLVQFVTANIVILRLV